MEIVIATVAVLREGDSILMLKRRPDDRWFPGSWCFPGGRVDAGEDLRAALRREIFEETGLGQVQIINEFEVMQSPWPERDRLYRVHCFSGVVERRGVRLSVEHSEARWIASRAEIPKPLAGRITDHLLQVCLG